MMLAELENILANLGKYIVAVVVVTTQLDPTCYSATGDEIPKDDVLKLFAEIADPEDEDGFFPYVPFMDKLTGK